MTSLFALTYPYLSGYQHLGASITTGVDLGVGVGVGVGGYSGGFGGQTRTWNQFGSLVNQAAAAATAASVAPTGCVGAYDRTAAAGNTSATTTSLPFNYGGKNTSIANSNHNHNHNHNHSHPVANLKTRKYTAKGTRSCPYNMNSLLGDDVSAVVRRRNERERERVRCVNNHYEHLKHHLPIDNFNREKRVSKLEILRTAIKYISELQDALERCNNNNTSESKSTRCHGTSKAATAALPSNDEKTHASLVGGHDHNKSM